MQKTTVLFVLSGMMLLASGWLLVGWINGDQEFLDPHYPPFVAEKIMNTRTESAASLKVDCGSGYPDVYYAYLVLPGRASPEHLGLDIRTILSHTRVVVRDADSRAVLWQSQTTASADGLGQGDEGARWKCGAVYLLGFEPPMGTKRMDITCTIVSGIRWPDTVTFALGSMQMEKGSGIQQWLWQEARRLYKYPIIGLAVAGVATFLLALRSRRREMRLAPGSPRRDFESRTQPGSTDPLRHAMSRLRWVAMLIGCPAVLVGGIAFGSSDHAVGSAAIPLAMAGLIALVVSASVAVHMDRPVTRLDFLRVGCWGVVGFGLGKYCCLGGYYDYYHPQYAGVVNGVALAAILLGVFVIVASRLLYPPPRTENPDVAPEDGSRPPVADNAGKTVPAGRENEPN